MRPKHPRNQPRDHANQIGECPPDYHVNTDLPGPPPEKNPAYTNQNARLSTRAAAAPVEDADGGHRGLKILAAVALAVFMFAHGMTVAEWALRWLIYWWRGWG